MISSLSQGCLWALLLTGAADALTLSPSTYPEPAYPTPHHPSKHVQGPPSWLSSGFTYWQNRYKGGALEGGGDSNGQYNPSAAAIHQRLLSHADYETKMIRLVSIITMSMTGLIVFPAMRTHPHLPRGG